MAAKYVNFDTSTVIELKFECISKWLSCNGELWGVGPTAVFASAAVLFLYNELESTILLRGDHGPITATLEKTLICTMMLGMLALMIHLWVCCMRFIQYYLETLIKDSPSVLLELTTVGLFGSQSDIVPLGPLTRFLRDQQPQIHITVCWFLSLCYADYVRKNYCHRFNVPYLEQWQTELQERALRTVRQAMEKLNNIVGMIHQQLRGFTQTNSQTITQTNLENNNTVEAPFARVCQWMSTNLAASNRAANNQGPCRTRSCPISCRPSVNRAELLQTLIRNSQSVSSHQDNRSTAVHSTPTSIPLGQPSENKENC